MSPVLPWLYVLLELLLLATEGCGGGLEQDCQADSNLLLLQRGAVSLQQQQLQMPTHRWGMWLCLLATLLLLMVLFWCDFASKRQTQAAGGAEAYLMEKKEGEVREDQSTLQLSDCQTVNDSVNYWASKTPEKRAFTFCDAAGNVAETRSFAELQRLSWAVAQLLFDVSGFGDRILLVYEPGLDFFDAFLGCLASGRVAVVVYPPMPSSGSSLRKFTAVQADCGAQVALTSSRYWWSTAVFFNAEWPSIIWKVTSNLKGPTISAELPKKISAEELAFLQYTSGSTGDAKGVMVSHANLMANCLIPCAHIGSPSHLGRERARPQFGPESIGITWLPHYHDMGLVATYLTALVWNVTLVGFSPLDFIKDPLLWPQLMSRYRGTVTAAPHFAYQLTARRIEAAEATKGALDLDLSSMVMAMDAAEPVNVRMREAMLTTWKRYGLPAGAYGVGYGLAEHVVKVTSGGVEGPEGMLGTVADCGSPWKDICLKIVDPETKMEMPEGEEGEIWLDSPSKALGYWKDPQSTRETFHARLASDGHVELSSSRSFLRTGDRGFMREGRLFVCGRIKNMIIIAGQNFYPQDIEQTVAEASEHVRPGQVVACSNAALTEEEQLLLALEVKDPEVYPENLATTLRARIEAEHGLLLWGLVLLKPRSLPKTTSGKLRHQKVAELFQTSFGSALVEKHFWGADADRDVHPIDWTGTSDRAARARRIEEWIVQEMPADAPSDSVVTSSAGAARLHARLLVALSAPCPGKDTVFHASVTSSHLPLSAVFADRAALARAAERAKFPEGPACPAPRRRTRREMVSTMTVQGKHKVPLVILWTWKTLGLLAPLLILLMPMFLLSTALDRLHLLYGHGLIMVLAPLLLAGVWALLLVQVFLLRLALFPKTPAPGRYKVDGWMHLRLWQLDVSLTFLHRFGAIYRGTPVHNALLRALGAEIGYGAKLNIFARASCQLLSAGAGCSVDESSVKCHCLLDGELILSPIHLPAHSSIGPRCVLEPGSTLTPGTLLRARSVVLLGGAEAEGEMKTKMCNSRIFRGIVPESKV
ncbi:unnamed protein product [Durusdinium trenchii]|uniref:AMP-dependent synthetase/ligase domain-containing protein n=1 Tax=Durusdinium trenchii TaxID=1381693 RepID=A0ABP0M3L8_9DINO